MDWALYRLFINWNFYQFYLVAMDSKILVIDCLDVQNIQHMYSKWGLHFNIV